MKNNNDYQSEIRKARETTIARATTDVLVNSAVIEQNASKVRPPKRRKINYTKKILNDDFIFNV